MALLDSTRTHISQSAVFADVVSRTAYRFISSISAWNEARRTRNRLMSLTNEELEDIGLSRADVDMMIARTRF